MAATLALGLTLTLAPLAQAAGLKAGDLVGRTVVTTDGDFVGQVQDFALDLEAGSIRYVVVSVGSFLIDDALIAIAPNALTTAAGSDQLLLDANNLADAKRFSQDNWPARADVGDLEKTAGASGGIAQNDAAEDATSGFDQSGSATITDGRRRATLAEGKQEIEPIAGKRSTKAPSTRKPDGPPPAFKTLDSNGNGRLSRREIGARVVQGSSYADIDLDSSGAIDSFEYEVFVQSLANKAP